MVFLIPAVIKRIETAKNRVKTEFEASVKNVDVKQKDWAFFAKVFDSKYKELQQAFVKRKRFFDIWVSLDRRGNDFLNQEIRTFRILDEIDPPAGLNESELVGSEEMSINDFTELFSTDYSQIFERFNFSSAPICFPTTFQK